MSFILDALRKSERERRTGEVPALSAVVDEAPAPRRPWLTWVIALLLSFNAIGLGHVWLTRQKSASEPAPMARTPAVKVPPKAPAEPSVAVAPPPGSPAAADVPPTTTIAQPAPPPPPVAVASPLPQPPTATIQRAPVPPTVSRVAPKAGVAPPPVKPRPRPPVHPEVATVRPPPRSASAKPAQPSATAKSPERGPMPHPPLAGLREPSAVPPERAAQAPRPPGREDIPNLRAMPLDFRVKVPDIRINLHAYSPLPAERFAIIDMKKYRAGDHLPSGVVVREIREESVVMELDGSKFKVPRP